LAYTGSVKVAWDDAKDLANRRKHGVSFEEAKGLFTSGINYLEIFDDAHSDMETERDEDTIPSLVQALPLAILKVEILRQADSICRESASLSYTSHREVQ
jgi:hypothetical protein